MLPQTPREALARIARLYSPLPSFITQRAVELALLARERWERPILDLGCGDGGFAEVLFGEAGTVDFGVDPDPVSVGQARKRGVYRRVVEAAGGRLPLESGSIATVFSNSVLEHIPDTEPVVAEVARVLKPGGRFVFTTPSERFPELLGTVVARRARGDVAGAEAHRRWFDDTHHHYHYEPIAVWREQLARHGMAIERWRYFMSPRGMRAFDGWISRQRRIRALLPQWVYRFFERWARAYDEPGPVLPRRDTAIDRLSAAVLSRWFLPHVTRELESTEPGGQLLVVAVKR